MKIEKEINADVKTAAESSAEREQPVQRRRYSKAWEAAQRLKGSVIINDPTLYER